MEANLKINLTGELVNAIEANAAANIANTAAIAELASRVAALEAQPAPPTTEPPPGPEPGEVVYSCDFTEAQFTEWTQENGYFERGNAKTHGSAQTGPDGQTTSLRMKSGECIDGDPGGCFPYGQGDSIEIDLPLAPGAYDVEMYRVAHDKGRHTFYVADGPDVLMSVEGTRHLSPLEWTKDTFQFVLAGNSATLAFAYTAPAFEVEKSGVKVTGLKVRRV